MGVQVQEQQQQEMRKGPWTEHEDILLVNYVQLFGDRRWDFIANVSGLKVWRETKSWTGKSCRLRWVNYLHPGLKHGKMTLREERLVLELHAKWGNRWSRIARKLPGRTDNEIKNYWRTHMRKMAQGSKRGGGLSSSPPPSPSSSSSSSSNCSAASSSTTSTVTTQGKASFYDTGGNINDDEMRTLAAAGYDQMGGYSMDDIWKDIELSEEKNIISKQGGGDFGASPANWDFCWDAMWKMGEESPMKLMMMSDDGAAADDAKFISSWAAAETYLTG